MLSLKGQLISEYNCEIIERGQNVQYSETRSSEPYRPFLQAPVEGCGAFGPYFGAPQLQKNTQTEFAIKFRVKKWCHTLF